MDYRVDLDPTHRVLRLTVRSSVMTLQCAEDCYICLSQIASRGGGDYAAIYDLTAVTGTTLSVDLIRGYARRNPSIPVGRTHVVVGKEPSIYGMARIFQMCREFLGEKFQVVRTLQEAYDVAGV